MVKGLGLGEISLTTATMPKKKNHNHGHGQGKSKKKQKYKPSPAEAPKKDEDEKIAVSDHVQDNSSPVPDAPPKDEIAPPKLENPGTNVDESSGDEHVDVQPKDSPEAPCNERPREQGSSAILVAFTIKIQIVLLFLRVARAAHRDGSS